MGLFDWMGGDRKKSAFREKMKEAISEGDLSAKKLAQIEAMRKEMDATPADDDKTKFRRQVYEAAVDAVRVGGVLTADEVHELARIQKYLGLRDDQIAQSKVELARLRLLSDIRQGKLPVVSPENVGLRRVQLEAGELPHYCVLADRFDGHAGDGDRGYRFAWTSPFQPNLARNHILPTQGAAMIESGSFVITSKQIVFRGDGRQMTIGFRQPEEIGFYSDGLRIRMRKSTELFRFRAKDVSDIVGVLLSRLVG